MLLLVTAEHDRCGTIPWYISSNNKEKVERFINETQAPIYVLDYSRSGKDNGPVVSECFYEMMETLKIFS